MTFYLALNNLPCGFNFLLGCCLWVDAGNHGILEDHVAVLLLGLGCFHFSLDQVYDLILVLEHVCIEVGAAAVAKLVARNRHHLRH